VGRHGSAGAPRATRGGSGYFAAPEPSAFQRSGTASPGRSERRVVWGAISGPPISKGRRWQGEEEAGAAR